MTTRTKHNIQVKDQEVTLAVTPIVEGDHIIVWEMRLGDFDQPQAVTVMHRNVEGYYEVHYRNGVWRPIDEWVEALMKATEILLNLGDWSDL